MIPQDKNSLYEASLGIGGHKLDYSKSMLVDYILDSNSHPPINVNYVAPCDGIVCVMTPSFFGATSAQKTGTAWVRQWHISVNGHDVGRSGYDAWPASYDWSINLTNSHLFPLSKGDLVHVDNFGQYIESITPYWIEFIPYSTEDGVMDLQVFTTNFYIRAK